MTRQDPATRRWTRPPYQFARGQRIGLPATGRGSPATMGRRAAAFAIDAILSSLVASAFVQIDPSLPGLAGRAPAGIQPGGGHIPSTDDLGHGNFPPCPCDRRSGERLPGRA